eukprot:g13312.t1
MVLEAENSERDRQTVVHELAQETADDETPARQSDSFARQKQNQEQDLRNGAGINPDLLPSTCRVVVRGLSGKELTVPAKARLRDVLRYPQAEDFFAPYKQQKGALCFTLADGQGSTENWLVQSGLRSGDETMEEIVEQLNKRPGREVVARVCDRTATGEEALNAPAELHLQAVMLPMPKRVRVSFPLPPFPEVYPFPFQDDHEPFPDGDDPFWEKRHLNRAVARGLLDLDGVWQREFPPLLTVGNLVARIRNHYKRYYVDPHVGSSPFSSHHIPLLINLPSLYLERVPADRAPANGEQEPAAQPPANGRAAKLQRLVRDRLARSQEEIDEGKTTGNLFPLVENNMLNDDTARLGLWEVCAQLPAEDDNSECTLRVVAPEELDVEDW